MVASKNNAYADSLAGEPSVALPRSVAGASFGINSGGNVASRLYASPV
jgi:hypothetical protein